MLDQGVVETDEQERAREEAGQGALGGRRRRGKKIT